MENTSSSHVDYIDRLTQKIILDQFFRTDTLQATEEQSMNRIPEDDSASSAARPPITTRDRKSDLISKVRSHHEKKGRRGNNRCRCRRRRRRGKVANLLHVPSN